MKKNKVISIFLLLITVLLSIGLGLCYNNKNEKMKPNTENPNNYSVSDQKNPNHNSIVSDTKKINEPFITKIEEQYLTFTNAQNLMRFTYLLSNDPTDTEQNIYTCLTTMPYYQEYLFKIKYPLTTISNYYPLAQFLYPKKDDTSSIILSPLNNIVQLSNLPFLNPFTSYDPSNNFNLTFKIIDDPSFKQFINTLYYNKGALYGPLIPHKDLNTNSQNFMTNLVKHYQNFQQDYLTAVDDNYTANMLELLEILYVSTFVPNSLYPIYTLEYNYVLNQYPGTFTDVTDDDGTDQDCKSAILCNTNSYAMFIQLYQSAMQLQLSINKLIDSSGNMIPGVDYTNSKSSDIHSHINNIMYMFDGKKPQYLFDLVNGLEPSYILFYNALYFFNVKLNS
jgi:hypothetical protein